ncbi:hypothetical protein [Staphylococcus warneri]|uniref:hypothetical protein n=1 Tax=Staphylococcus warneri TaxID=1292 RepID=UPI001FB528A0|nr:hypothetical protein [Staphylococcus warneri]MCJ1787575.1 hypothetical protein [Staphylococcus warneri]MCJ1790067.1 hypothetical protein [Staphylococcus warneri]MCJ1792466.1 hypothetical protein [Staphylococcus warneri]MCJ1794954.1 hypothetical protein [Staphylococcus warneri]MCJ1797339.1 hypothetical protein [Staphylococcus warneri]
MKINKWIMWVILFSSLFGIANKGVSVIAFILSIFALTKFVLVDKKSINTNKNNSNTNVQQPKQTSNKEFRQKERTKKKEEKVKEKEQAREQEKQIAMQRSHEYFGVDFIDANVTKSKATPYYNKIKTDTEQVIDVINARATKNVKNYKRYGYHLETTDRGILILTTENIYFLTAHNGFTKTVYPIKNVNGINTSMANLYITYGRTKHIFNIEGWKRSDLFMQNYIKYFYS